MQEKRLYKLKIDEEFQKLIPELTKEESDTLEELLLKEGCREPICVWNDYIIDGHNRYFLCHKNNIPFNFQEVPDLKTKEDVLDWMCANQLGRRNISEKTRMYLIGKRFNLEKKGVQGNNNATGINQYSIKEKIEKSKTSEKLAEEYNVSPVSIYRYARFANAIDNISKKESTLANRILNGQIKFTRADVNNLSNQTEKDLGNINKKLSKHKIGKSSLAKNKLLAKFKQASTIPDYDPDSDVMSLALTIPYWIDSVDRIINKKDINDVSKNAKWKLITELGNIDIKIKEITLIMENSDG